MPRKYLILAGALLCAGAAAHGETAATTALGALKLLPKGSAAKVALIEAREGKPAPSRWHILVHDPKEENGVREFVVANGEVVASRNLSQFAESLSADEVLGEGIKVDSDRVAKLAQQYADANKLELAEMNFELKRDGEGAVPIWNVTCLDAAGNELGHLVLTATKGTIVSHEGFATDPKPADTALVLHADPIADKKPPTPKKPEVRKAVPVGTPAAAETPKAGLFQHGGPIQRLFTGH